jgi:nucleoside-diphosphate-sugar epimerase
MKVLVTGGGGFLGKAIVRLLCSRGDQVRSLARGNYPELEKLGVEVHRGDLADAAAVSDAVARCDLVFHTAAKAGIWGPYAEYHQTNVVGTSNVVAGCRSRGVRRLVFTSSPSVVFDGGDMEGVDESVPYADHFEAHYPKTKALAERIVLEANGPDLATVALRPHFIWGPEDNHLIPRLLARARAGTLRRVGRTDKLIDSVYVDNAAEAHLLAGDRLAPGSPIAGKAYFITQGEPVAFWGLIDRILAAAGLPGVTRTVSARAAYVGGWMLETIHALLRLRSEPRMTRFLARELSTAHWFNIGAARRDLDYVPKVSTEEGLRRLREWLQQGEADSALEGLQVRNEAR